MLRQKCHLKTRMASKSKLDFDHILEVVLVDPSPPIISWALASRRRSFHIKEFVAGGGWECSRLREYFVDEFLVVDDASSSVFDDPPLLRTAFKGPGLIPSTNPGLSFPPRKLNYDGLILCIVHFNIAELIVFEILMMCLPVPTLNISPIVSPVTFVF